MQRLGDVQGGILSIIFGGVTVGLVDHKPHYYKIPSQFSRSQKKTSSQSFNRSIKSLVDKKLLEEKKMSDGSIKLVLSKEGKRRALLLGVIKSSIKFNNLKKWDKKWRLVIFDIPEKNREFRSILRNHLYALDFFNVQKSVFVSPHPYEKSILKLVTLYSAQPYVRVITAEKVDNQSELIKYFFRKGGGKKKKTDIKKRK